MAVSVQMPGQKEKKDPLDTIIKGLGVATQIYGIAEASDKAKLLKEQRDAEISVKQEAQKRQQTQDQFTQAATEAGLADRGFQKQVGEDGKVSFLRTPGYKSLDDRKKEAEIAKTYAELNKARSSGNFENLPKDKQIQIEKLSGKISDRKQIANDIDAALAQLDDPKLTSDQKIMVSRELAKTLNSSQGADAIGSEEAKRLLGLIDFKVFNVTEPGSMFGRDLGMFTEQVRNNRNRLTESLGSSQRQIDEMMGRAPGLVPPGVYVDASKAAGAAPNQNAITLDSFTPRANAAAPASAPKGMVTVSNGKETLFIPQADVEAAKKDGYQVIK